MYSNLLPQSKYTPSILQRRIFKIWKGKQSTIVTRTNQEIEIEYEKNAGMQTLNLV